MKTNLITIPYSHYNEQARWVLDYFGVPYVERGYLPVLHLPAVIAHTLGRGVGRADRASTRFSTPLLLSDRKERISDSRRIMRYLSDRYGDPDNDLYPSSQVETLLDRFHDRLGIPTRKLAYYHLVKDIRWTDQMVRRSVPSWQHALFKLVGGPLTGVIFDYLKIQAESVDEALTIVRDELHRVEVRLQRGPYLVGDRLSAADISFACLAAPVLWVTQADGHSTIPDVPGPLPAGMASVVDEMRTSEAGKFVLRLFRKARRAQAAA